MRPPHDLFIDPGFEQDYRQHPFVLVDAGARGGLKRNWAAARPHLRVIGFEPDRREYLRLTDASTPADPMMTWFDVALHNRRGPIRLHVARDRGLSSIFEPDREFLDAFPQADRFDTIEIVEVEADTLDNLLQTRGAPPVDFLKVDTQGSELFVLQGASRTLATSTVGVEVEVEFAAIYRGQPLFADVDGFLRGLGFALFDLRPVYWKRAAGRAAGGPRGQMIWADALYLKTQAALDAMLQRVSAERRRSMRLKAISAAILYGYIDYAIELARCAGPELSADQRSTVERRLRDRSSTSTAFPFRRQLAAALHRLWRVAQPRDQEAWSISGSDLGNSG